MWSGLTAAPWRDAADLATLPRTARSWSSLLDGDLTSRRVQAEGLPLEVRRLPVGNMLPTMSRFVEKRGQPVPADITATAERCLAAAETAKDLNCWRRVAQTLLRFGLGDARTMAATAERLIADADDPFQVKEYWEFAASCFDRAADEAEATRCRLAAAEQMVVIARHMSPALASSSWLMDAIDALRRLPGTRDRRAELEIELRAAQRASIDEMGSFTQEIDLEELVTASLANFEDTSLSTALGMLAELGRPMSIQDLRAEARETLSGSAAARRISRPDDPCRRRRAGRQDLGQAGRGPDRRARRGRGIATRSPSGPSAASSPSTAEVRTRPQRAQRAVLDLQAGDVGPGDPQSLGPAGPPPHLRAGPSSGCSKAISSRPPTF